jgi:transcriptional regulator with XRE-family HTH domain
VSEDWAAVSKAINERVMQLGWRQRELAQRSNVSQAIVRELQHHTVERRRSPRTLESLSAAMGWHPGHLEAVLEGRTPPKPPEPIPDLDSTLWARLDRLEDHLAEISESIAGMRTDLKRVIDRTDRDR